MIYLILDFELKTITYLTDGNLYMADELCPNGFLIIRITKELQQALLYMGKCRLIKDIEDREYTIKDKELFESVNYYNPLKEKSLNEVVYALGKEVSKIKIDLMMLKGGI